MNRRRNEGGGRKLNPFLCDKIDKSFFFWLNLSNSGANEKFPFIPYHIINIK